ncbi:MAG: DUF89 family protein [Clostridia bacterium]|nr:DUF89 family protein [Clostridia bacterium]
MNANVSCITCLMGKIEKTIRGFQDEAKKMDCLQEIMAFYCREGRDHSAPYLSRGADAIVAKYFGEVMDWRPVKSRYNQYMLGKEALIEARIRQSADVLAACIQHVCAGNYIDFGAVDQVDDTILESLLRKAAAEKPDPQELEHFRRDLEGAKRLVYLTDNCGEVVLDKLFVKLLKEMYPQIDVTVVVRGAPAVNDATLEDAYEVGLTAIAPCMGNGSNAPSTLLAEISPEVKALLKKADVIIAKGQGNFEGLYGEGLNPYFMFLCKCELFVRRFGLGLYASVFAREDRIRMIF